MIHIVIGTRAQLIKMLPLMRMMKMRSWDYNFVLLPQHRATIYEILDEFDLKHPDVVVAENTDDITKTWQMIFWSIRVLVEGLWHRSRIFRHDKHGIVLVHGDAPPLLLGALLAKAQGLRVAQVEAGLRSYDLRRPFPEEATRVAAGRLGLIDVHFCQDETAQRNAEHYPGETVLTSGNTIADTLAMVERLNTEALQERFALVSLHRYETITDARRMEFIVDKLVALSEKISLNFILHPPTKVALNAHKLMYKLEQAERISLSPRMTFIAFQQALAQAELLVSDGGSNQEECAYLGIPCLLLREKSERTEGLGSNVVLSSFDERVIDDFFDNYQDYSIRTELNDRAPSEVILEHLEAYA